MAAVPRDQGIRRRLPQWLLGSKSDGADKQGKLDAQKFATEKTQTGRHNDSHLVVDREIKDVDRRKSRNQQRGDEKSGKIGEAGARRDEELESGARKRKRATNSNFERREVIKSKPPSNGEVDLTVEDLLLIAKETLKEDGEFKSLLLKPEVSMNEFGSCGDHLKTGSSLSAHGPDLSYDSNPCSMELRKTGDSAQEMLDLFLGPLLKRPVEEKKEMELSFELERKLENNNGGSGEVISLGKKKGSLRDKVAMFLN